MRPFLVMDAGQTWTGHSAPSSSLLHTPLRSVSSMQDIVLALERESAQSSLEETWMRQGLRVCGVGLSGGGVGGMAVQV